MPFSTAGMNWRGIAPPTILSTNSKPGAAFEWLHADERDTELAVPAGLLLVLALGLGGAGDRLAVGDLHVLGLDLDTELAVQLLERDRHVRLAHARAAASAWSRRCARSAAPGPRPGAGAARWRACPRRPSTSGGSRRRAPARAPRTARRRSRRRGRRARHRWWCRASLATAAMSPAGTSDAGLLLLAPHRRELVEPLVGHACGR